MKLVNENVWDRLLDKKEGYELIHVIATTFTLSTDILPSLLLKIAECDGGLESAKSLSDEEKYILLSRSIESTGKKLTVFSDDHLIPSHNRSSEFQKFVNEYCIPNLVVRTAPEKCFFHPKLMIAHFRSESSGKDHIRIAVLSKNLTLSVNVVEIAAVFESADTPGDGTEVMDVSRCVCDLFDDICSIENPHLKRDEELCGISFPREKAGERIRDTLDALRGGMRFRLSEEFQGPVPSEARLLIGMPSMKGDRTPGSRLLQDLKSASYWCSDSISADFMDRLNCRYMVSNLRSFRNLLMKDGSLMAAKDIPDNYYTLINASTKRPRVVHAKFMEGPVKDGYVTVLGSANFTHQAFYENYECVLRLEYRGMDRPACGPGTGSAILENAFEIASQPGYVLKRVKEPDVYAELMREDENQDFERKLKGLDWRMSPDPVTGKLEISADNTGSESFSEAELKKITGMEVVLPGKRLSLGADMDDGNPIRFFTECEKYKDSMIPWYGYMNLVYYSSYNRPEVIPVKVRVDFPAGSKVEQKVIAPGAPGVSDEISGILLRGKMFNLRSVIPAEPKGTRVLYRSDDSLELRQAKYLSKGGDVKEIISSISLVKKMLQAAVFDEDDDFSETTETVTEDMIEHMKKRYEKYEEMLKT